MLQLAAPRFLLTLSVAFADGRGMTLLHANCVVVDGAAVLIRGPSGCGKSDLSLRLIDGGAALLADDYVELAAENGRLVAHTPERIAGLIEVRGIGLARLPYLSEAPVALIVDLVSQGREGQRMPEAETVEIEGIRLPRLCLAALECSTPAKIRLQMRLLAESHGTSDVTGAL